MPKIHCNGVEMHYRPMFARCLVAVQNLAKTFLIPFSNLDPPSYYASTTCVRTLLLKSTLERIRTTKFTYVCTGVYIHEEGDFFNPTSISHLAVELWNS